MGRQPTPFLRHSRLGRTRAGAGANLALLALARVDDTVPAVFLAERPSPRLAPGCFKWLPADAFVAVGHLATNPLFGP